MLPAGGCGKKTASLGPDSTLLIYLEICNVEFTWFKKSLLCFDPPPCFLKKFVLRGLNHSWLFFKCIFKSLWMASYVCFKLSIF